MRRTFLPLVVAIMIGCDDEKSSSPKAQAPPQLAVMELRQLPGIESNEFWSASIAPDGKTLLVSDNGNGVRIFDLSTSKQLHSFPTFISVTASALSLDGKQALLSSGADEKHGPLLLDVGAGKVLRAFEGQKTAITCLAFLSNGGSILSGAEDIHIWERETGKDILRYPLGENEQVVGWAPHEGHSLVAIVKKSRKDQFDTAFRILDLSDKKDLHTFSGPSCNQVDSVALAPKSNLVLILYSRLVSTLGGIGPPGWHAFLQVRRMSDGKELFDTKLGYWGTRIVLHPDEQRFFVAGKNLHEWQLREK